MMKKYFIPAVSAAVLLTMGLTSCETPAGQGAGFGAVTGAVAGALIGGAPPVTDVAQRLVLARGLWPVR